MSARLPVRGLRPGSAGLPVILALLLGLASQALAQQATAPEPGDTPAPPPTARVEPGWLDASLTVAVQNGSADAAVESLQVAPRAAPGWIRNLRVEPAGQGALPPGGRREFIVRFDVAPDARPGQREPIVLDALGAPGWQLDPSRLRVVLEVVPASTVALPNLENRPITDARRVLAALGLPAPRLVGGSPPADPDQAHTVEKQDPLRGPVGRDTVVTLKVRGPWVPPAVRPMPPDLPTALSVGGRWKRHDGTILRLENADGYWEDVGYLADFKFENGEKGMRNIREDPGRPGTYVGEVLYKFRSGRIDGWKPFSFVLVDADTIREGTLIWKRIREGR